MQTREDWQLNLMLDRIDEKNIVSSHFGMKEYTASLERTVVLYEPFADQP